MNRLFVSTMMFIVLIVPLTVSHAIDLGADNPHNLADFMLDSTEVYIGSRMGADYFNELDTIALAVYGKLPDGLDFERKTIADYMREQFDDMGYDWDSFQSLLGDYVAVGIESHDGTISQGDDPYMTLVAEITDRKAFLDALITMTTPLDALPPNFADGTDDLVYQDLDVIIYATDTHFIFSNNPAYEFPVATPLSSISDFQNALAMLPAVTYSGLAYVSADANLEEFGRGQMRDAGILETDAIAIGITALEDNVLAFDFAVQTNSPLPASIDTSDVLSLLPEGTDAFIVATDLTQAYNTLISLAQTLSTEDDDPTERLPMFFGMTGLDLEDDVLSWTTGDYAVFMSADVENIVNQIEADEKISDLLLEFGVVIEATDPALARQTADKLGDFFDVMLGNDEMFTIEQVDDASPDFPKTTLTLDLPNDDLLDVDSVEFVITANDDVLYMGTGGAFDTLNSGATLSNDADVNGAMSYLLDNPTSVWYLNGEGVTIPVLSGVGVRISPNGTFATPETIFEFVRSIDDIINAETISTSVDDNGVVRLRATVTLHP